MKTAIAIPLKKSRKIKINVFLRGSCFQRGCFFVGTEKRRQLPAAGKNLYDVYHLPEIPEGSSCWGFCLGARFHGFLECGNSCLQITVCGIHSILVCSGTIINCFSRYPQPSAKLVSRLLLPISDQKRTHCHQQKSVLPTEHRLPCRRANSFVLSTDRTVTLQVAILLPSSVVTVMVVVPGACAITLPLSSTVATA